LSPTPLKNDGVKVSWDDEIHIYSHNIWKNIIQMFQNTNQIYGLRLLQYKLLPLYILALECPRSMLPCSVRCFSSKDMVNLWHTSPLQLGQLEINHTSTPLKGGIWIPIAP